MSIRVCRWGILSTAVIGHKNWQAIHLSGNGQVVGVASRDAQRAQEFIDANQREVAMSPAPTAYGDYQSLIDAEDVDAVYVPLPTGIRKEWVIKAAEAGKHVMCEKPCACSADDLQEMIDACAANNVQFMDGVMFMHSKRLSEMRKVLDDGESVGQLKRIATQFSFLAPEEFKQDNIRTACELEPQGTLGDLGWYCLRFILWARGFKAPVQVCGRQLDATRRSGSGGETPMEFSGELLWDDGVSASFYCSFNTALQQWANISGTRGYLHVPDFVLPFYGNQLNFSVHQADFVEEGCDFRMENYVQQYGVAERGNGALNAQETELFRNFSELVLNGEVDETWPRISMLTQRVLDGCLESARNESNPVSIGELSAV